MCPRKEFGGMFVAILKILLFCWLLTYCISLNGKYGLEENRSDLQVRGSAKMGFEPKRSNLEARLPFPACQMCSEGNYHGPRRARLRTVRRQRSAPGRNLHRIPGLPWAADWPVSFLPAAQWPQVALSACLQPVNP